MKIILYTFLLFLLSSCSFKERFIKAKEGDDVKIEKGLFVSNISAKESYIMNNGRVFINDMVIEVKKTDGMCLTKNVSDSNNTVYYKITKSNDGFSKVNITKNEYESNAASCIWKQN